MSDAPAHAAPRPAPAALPGVDAVEPGFAVALLFFVSGVAGLLLETAAVRAFLELFGSTAASLGAVGGAFLVCLAIGAFVVGSRADRAARPLRWYALLEGVACVGGLLALRLLPRLDGLATALARAEIAGEPRLGPRLLACAALLIVPVGALGATLPVLARVRALSRSRGSAAGGLQVASTLGAMAGALLGASLLLGEIGTRGTWRLACALSGAAALAAAWLARGVRAGSAAGSAAASGPAPGATVPLPPLCAAAFLAGFSVLALEVLIFRGMGQVARGSQDTLGALLAAFLGASAVGSALGIRLSRRDARTGFVVGQALALVTPLAALAWLRAMSRAGELDWLRFGAAATTWIGRLGGELIGALLVAGPAALATAVAFPCACELGRERRFGRMVAWLSGAWTLGAAAGGLAAPGLMLPRLGLRGALLVVAALPIAALAAVALADRGLLRGRRRIVAGGALAAAAALVALPIAGGSAWSDPLLFFRRVAGSTAARLLDYREDAAANVAVVERADGTRVLAVNDQLALGGSGAGEVELMQGVLPALLHPSPRRALVLGVGAGVTASALRQMGCTEVDAVELLPAVLDMLPWFAADNGALALDRAVRLHATDARAFVRAAEPGSYDLVVGDLFFPWEAESGLLYTLEHFERVKRLLRPDGLFCQWLPGHQLRWEELGLAGRTFAEAFAGATVWLARPDFPYPILGLVAGAEHLEIDVPTLARRLEGHAARELLARLGVADVKELLALYVAGGFFFRDRFDDRAINRADRAIVEYRAARRVETDVVVALINRRRLFETHEDIVYRMVTPAALDRKQVAALKRELSAAAQAMWRLFDARTSMLLAAANRELPPAARRNDPAELEAQAFQEVGALMRDRPDHAPASELMLALLGQQLRLGDFARVVEGVTTLENEPAIGERAALRYLRGMAFLRAVCDPDERKAALFTRPLEFAIRDLRRAAELDPRLVEASLHLGIALFLADTTEARDEARVVLQATREKIVAPGRPDGRGLPAPAEAVLAFLLGHADAGRQWLQRPESQPWAARIAEAARRLAPGS